MNQRYQPLRLSFVEARALAQRQIAKPEADAVADLTKICQLVRIANGNLHRWRQLVPRSCSNSWA
jgi:hypothetical protein